MKLKILLGTVRAHLKRLFLAYIEGQFVDPGWSSLRYEIDCIINELKD